MIIICLVHTYFQRGHDGVHQFSFQVCSVSQMSFVVVKRVVQVGDWTVCKQRARAHTHTSVHRSRSTHFIPPRR